MKCSCYAVTGDSDGSSQETDAQFFFIFNIISLNIVYVCQYLWCNIDGL